MTVHYQVGNEHNPSDPWGRSELTIQPDGAARLEHHFSRVPKTGRWTGRVDRAALDRFFAALDRAGFPDVPGQLTALRPGATIRRLTVDVDGVDRQVLVAGSPPGYIEAFDLLDGVIRQLSGGRVPYPTTQPTIVTRHRPWPWRR